jgi:HPt (histidine-containing phosphotransfer) domain-containing protein
LGTGSQSAMSDALARLWEKFLPEILQRVRVLENAAAALESGILDADDRLAAAAAAHKLAGVLGTFGLAEGTSLAREAEVAYSESTSPDAAGMARLQQIARELNELIRARG